MLALRVLHFPPLAWRLGDLVASVSGARGAATGVGRRLAVSAPGRGADRKALAAAAMRRPACSPEPRMAPRDAP